jgi:hypothetical protein
VRSSRGGDCRRYFPLSFIPTHSFPNSHRWFTRWGCRVSGCHCAFTGNSHFYHGRGMHCQVSSLTAVHSYNRRGSGSLFSCLPSCCMHVVLLHVAFPTRLLRRGRLGHFHVSFIMLNINHACCTHIPTALHLFPCLTPNSPSRLEQ